MLGRRAAIAAIVLLGALAACSGSGGRSGSLLAPPSSSPPPPSKTPPLTGTARVFTRTWVPDSALIKTIAMPQSASFLLERVPGLHFQRPVCLTHAGDGSGRIFVCELRGVIYAIANTTSSVFLDISSQVHSGIEEGLFSIAFHPQFKTNGRAFVTYTTGTSYTQGAPDQVRVRLSRFTLVPGNPNALDPSSETVLLEIPKRFNNHNGGGLAFGPDRYLYMSTGDGGCCGDPEKNAQNLGSLKGKILRIDVDQGATYGIPADNPFVSTPNARGEVWAYGLRNPWRFSFDRATGRLWAGDVGQDQWEEVDLVAKGANYGWSAFEGDHVYDASVPAPGAVAPLLEYDHTVGRCVIGGCVYNGPRLLGLQGAYLFADYWTGQVWAARYDGTRITTVLPVANDVAPSICSFGEDEAGEVYALSYGTGNVFTLAAVGAPTGFPATLSATGLFSSLASQTLRPEALPYGVVEPLWSDAAIKTRHMLLPHLDQVQWKPQNGWSFPADAILVKSFWLERVRGDPKTKEIVETRLLVNQQGGWRGYSYEWNDTKTDASLLEGSKHKDVAVLVSGQPTLQDWYFPSRSDCLRCHTEAAGFVLGPQTPQLNSDFDYTPLGGALENQLSALSRIGVFAQPLPGSPASFGRFSAHGDPLATLDERARTYLHVNCAHCHRPDGGAPVDLDLRHDTPLADMHLVGVSPQAGDMGVQGSVLVKKGDPQSSVLYLRTSLSGPSHMPPLGTSVIDPDGAQLIADWITHLP